MNNYTEVNVTVTGQALQLASVPLIASGGINSVKVIFAFDSLWDGMAKTAVFYTDPKQAVQVLLTDDWAVVPSEILGKDGTFSLGVFGTNEEQVLPSALVEISINKGAASLQPVDPAEPTPDIYSQIMSAYAVLKARMDALVTMKGIGAEYGTVSDAHVNGIFKSNGYSAFLNFTISGLSLAAGDRHYTDYFLSANRAPLSTVEMETSDPALKVTIEAPTAEGLSRVLIENISSTDYAADKFTIVTAFYPLANTGNTEVTDMRVGYDNTVYPTAAEAVRTQFSKIATDAAEQRLTHFMITYDEEADSWICSTPYIGLQNRLGTHRLQSLVMVKGHTFCSVDRIENDPDDGVNALDLYTEWGVFRFSPDESIVKIAEPESGGGDSTFVRIDANVSEDGTLSLSKDYEEIVGILMDGKVPYLYLLSSVSGAFVGAFVHFSRMDYRYLVFSDGRGVVVEVYDDDSIYFNLDIYIGRKDLTTHISDTNPTNDGAVTECAVKEYVDGKIGDISSALDELHAYAETLKGGDAV